MQRLRYKDVKDDCGAALNLPASDTRLPGKVNEVQERVLYSGKWTGTVATYAFCIKNNCVVLPREIETIEGISLCDVPMTIHNGWYEFLESGPGNIDCNCGEIVDKGEVPAFDVVIGTDKKLAVFADGTEATAKYITLQFYNKFGHWVRSQFGGAWIDGERIAIPAAGTYNYTVNEIAPGGLVRVIKDKTDGTVRLYEYTTTTGALKPLGYYQPDEEIPIYRAYQLPLSGSGTSATCSSETVRARVKLRYIPVAKDDDFLLIGHRGALRLGCKALQKEDADLPDQAVRFWQLCYNALNDQLSHHEGSGPQMGISMNRRVFGGAIKHIQ